MKKKKGKIIHSKGSKLEKKREREREKKKSKKKKENKRKLVKAKQIKKKKKYYPGLRLRVNCEGGELERGWLQEPVRRSVRGTPETDVFRQHTVGPLRRGEVTLRWNHRRYIQQTPNFLIT